jgi:hypothetical protein
MSTIHRWHEEWLARHEFRPDESKRSQNHRKFTDEQKAEIRGKSPKIISPNIADCPAANSRA